MKRVIVPAVLLLSLAMPAYAQHQGHETAPQTPAQTTPLPQPQQAAPADQHGQHGERNQAGASATARPDQHAGHNIADEAIDPPDAGNDVPPDAPSQFAADRFFQQDDMNRARGVLRDEHGGGVTYKIMADQIEYASDTGEDGYRWNGEVWFGGDINRLVIKTEGEGGDDIENAEIQALYSRAWNHITDLQIGMRHDLEPGPSRTYLAVGFETLLPYWFEAEGAVFVGERGQVLARLDGSYDFQLTQRLVLQPRAEINFAAAEDAAMRTGSGLSNAEIGVRLRYEIRREFAPYVGVVWERKFGSTADFARVDGERTETTSFVVGLRAWY